MVANAVPFKRASSQTQYRFVSKSKQPVLQMFHIFFRKVEGKVSPLDERSQEYSFIFIINSYGIIITL